MGMKNDNQTEQKRKKNKRRGTWLWLIATVCIASLIMPYASYAQSQNTGTQTVSEDTDRSGSTSASGEESEASDPAASSSQEEEPVYDTSGKENTEGSSTYTSSGSNRAVSSAGVNTSAEEQEVSESGKTEAAPETVAVNEAEESNSSKESSADELNPDIDTVLAGVYNYILSNDTNPNESSMWNIIGLTRSGLDVPQTYIDTFYKNMISYCNKKNWKLTNAKYSEYSKLILAMTAIGVDARDVAGHNLLSYLSDYKNVSRQGNNGPIWALIALKSNPAYVIPTNQSAKEQTTEDLLVERVLAMQLDDGGWTLAGSKGDTDMTGMAMQALSSYYGVRDDVTEAFDKGMEWLSENQLTSGGYGTMGVETSESVAQVIVALSSAGIDCGQDERFIKNGKWPMTGLFQYYLSEGGFMHVAKDAGNNGGGAGGTLDGMATEQGFYATVAYKRLLEGKTALYDMSDVEIAPGEDVDSGSSTSTTATTTEKKTSTKTSGTSSVKVSKLSLDYSKIYVIQGKSKKLTVSILPTNASNKKVTWTSSNKKIASVNAKGKVTGKKAGTVTITATAKDGSKKKASCKVIVVGTNETTQKSAAATTRSVSKFATTKSLGNSTAKSSTAKGAAGTSATTSTKKSTGSTSKKSSEATTSSGWSFEGDNYVPESDTSEETASAETISEKGEEHPGRSKKQILTFVGGGVGGLVVIEAIGLALYQRRKR